MWSCINTESLSSVHKQMLWMFPENIRPSGMYLSRTDITRHGSTFVLSFELDESSLANWGIIIVRNDTIPSHSVQGRIEMEMDPFAIQEIPSIEKMSLCSRLFIHDPPPHTHPKRKKWRRGQKQPKGYFAAGLKDGPGVGFIKLREQ